MSVYETLYDSRHCLIKMKIERKETHTCIVVPLNQRYKKQNFLIVPISEGMGTSTSDISNW